MNIEIPMSSLSQMKTYPYLSLGRVTSTCLILNLPSVFLRLSQAVDLIIFQIFLL